MNCPHCHEAIGTDQWAWGEPKPQIFDHFDNAIDGIQTLYVSGEFCGEMEIDFDFFGRIKAVRGPFTQPRDCRRVLSHLPAHRGRPLPQQRSTQARRRKSA